MTTRRTLRFTFFFGSLLIAATGLAGCASPVLTPTPKINPTSGATVSAPAVAPTPVPSAVPTTPIADTFTYQVKNISPRQFDAGLPTGYAMAELLGGQRVLIAGGVGPDNLALASAQLYWPENTTGPLVSTGAMNEARTDFSMTTLAGGQILVAGGAESTNGTTLASAETYNALTGVFSTTGAMKFARENPLTLALPDGRAVVLGGDQGCWQDECKLLTSAEIYDPTTGLFTLLTNKLTARIYQTATLLADGQILIVGGENAQGTTLFSAELLDPTSGKVTPTGSPAVFLDSAAAVLLPDGQVLFAGGSNIGDTSAIGAAAELYNPATGKFTETSPMLAPTGVTVALLLPDNQVFLAGSPVDDSNLGFNFSNPSVPVAELYDPATGTFRAAGNLPSGFGPNLGCLLANGTVFLYGHDYDASGNLDGIEIYQP